MLNVGVTLDRLTCNFDPESSAEPYMWTCFLHADMDTISLGPGRRLATYTPHADWTTRGAFPDGINAGESVGIPPSLGSYEVVLDPGVFQIAIVGALFVLMEQDSTPGYAIRAGHEAFAGAVDSALNTYVDQHFPDTPDPTAAEIQAMASQIQGEVMGAIKDELSPIHLFYNHDAFYGFGYVFLSDLAEISVGGVSTTRQFSSRISGVTGAGAFSFPFDYQVELRVTCQPDQQPPTTCLRQYEVYREAADEVDRIDHEIRRLVQELGAASEDERGRLKRELQELLTLRRPAAVDLLDSAHRAYQLCRDPVFERTADDLSGNRLQMTRAVRLASSAHGQLPAQATVAEPALQE